jgi:hypothetical protein
MLRAIRSRESRMREIRTYGLTRERAPHWTLSTLLQKKSDFRAASFYFLSPPQNSEEPPKAARRRGKGSVGADVVLSPRRKLTDPAFATLWPARALRVGNAITLATTSCPHHSFSAGGWPLRSRVSFYPFVTAFSGCWKAKRNAPTIIRQATAIVCSKPTSPIYWISWRWPWR